MFGDDCALEVEAVPHGELDVALHVLLPLERRLRPLRGPRHPEGNRIKIGLPGKLILSKRKGLQEVLFS